MNINEEELKKKVGEDAYRIIRQKGTEAPFTGEYVKKLADGKYNCRVCGTPLFDTDSQEDATKSPPGLAGWPSFNNAIPGATVTRTDNSLGMSRTEIVCANCQSHLGHLFDDSGTATGKHYCVNSACLDLDKS